jgi:hypothetical protein
LDIYLKDNIKITSKLEAGWMADRVGVRGRTIEVFVQFRDQSGEPVNTDTTPSVEITDANGVVRQILMEK